MGPISSFPFSFTKSRKLLEEGGDRDEMGKAKAKSRNKIKKSPKRLKQSWSKSWRVGGAGMRDGWVGRERNDMGGGNLFRWSGSFSMTF